MRALLSALSSGGGRQLRLRCSKTLSPSAFPPQRQLSHDSLLRRPSPSPALLRLSRQLSGSWTVGAEAKPPQEVSKDRRPEKSYGSVVERVLDEQAESKVPSTRVEKVAQAGRDVWYLGLGAVGLAMLGGLGWLVARELFSRESPNSVYAAALRLIRNSDEAEAVFGSPIAAHGEGKRRRRHIASVPFVDDTGRKRLRMQFHLKGPLATGNAQLEMREDETGRMDYRYLFVQSDELPPKVVVLIDNR